MKPRSICFLILASLCLAACQSVDTAGTKKKKPRPPLPGEEDSELSWNRPTRQSEVGTPFGLPTSR